MLSVNLSACLNPHFSNKPRSESVCFIEPPTTCNVISLRAVVGIFVMFVPPSLLTTGLHRTRSTLF